MRHLEHAEQVALVQWAYMTKLPTASDVKPGAVIGHYLFAVPNGGKRSKSEAARFKAEGVKSGVSDLILPLRRHQCAGLFLEMKARGNRPTAVQEEWLERMELAGYLATWRDNWIDAAGVIARYVGVREPQLRVAPVPVPAPVTKKRAAPCSGR